MKFYKGFKDVPELANLSWRQRGKLMRKARFSSFVLHQWPFWLGQLVLVICVLAGDGIGLMLQYGFGLSEKIHYACALSGLVIGGWGYALIYYNVLVERFRPHLREYLATHQVPN